LEGDWSVGYWVGSAFDGHWENRPLTFERNDDGTLFCKEFNIDMEETDCNGVDWRIRAVDSDIFNFVVQVRPDGGTYLLDIASGRHFPIRRPLGWAGGSKAKAPPQASVAPAAPHWRSRLGQTQQRPRPARDR
jgi:hypothetical protein